ncbi:MAG: hypothetical protein EOP06_19310, partial [Proteobacteria bacterium]
MKSATLIFSFIFIGSLVHADESVNVEQRRTSRNGTVFTRVTTHPHLPEAYVDPSGLVWADIARDQWGYDPAKMTAPEAEKYCRSIGARQPTAEENNCGQC